MTLNRALAYDASRDAGNRNMRRCGRSAWNEEDYDFAASEFARLAQYCVDVPDWEKQAIADAE